MTQIQLRRDTSTNWTTNNPTPASGEPCYETDTGKLKIGNGTTPYNDLEYIGNGGGGETYTLPPATADTLGGIKVGTNLSITDDGTLSATSSTPSNMVTTNTSQTISGDKTFTAHDIILYATEASTLSKIRGRYSNGTRDIINPTGSTYSGPSFGSTYRVTELASDPSVGVEVLADGDTPTTTAATGRLLHTGNMLGCITAGDNISITETGTGRNRQMIISSTGGSSYELPVATTTTLGGVKPDGSTITVTSDGTISANTTIPSNMVTTDTDQTITGSKTFSALGVTTQFQLGTPIRLRGNSAYQSAFSAQNGQHNKTLVIGTTSSSETKWEGLTVSCAQRDTSRPTQGVIQITDGTNSYTVIDTGNFSTSSPTGNLKYWAGTETEYTAITTKDPDTLYRTTDTNKVFLGTIQLGG